MLIDQIVTREPINKGWSGDMKFRITVTNGTSYLLRISPEELHDRKQFQFRRMEQLKALGIPMCSPVEFGICEDGVYSIQSWIDGQDAEEVIPTLSLMQLYAFGCDAGQVLQKMHTIPAPGDAESWSDRFNRKIDRKIKSYLDCPLKYEHGELFLAHIAKSRRLLDGRPQSYQHGDYHIGNMMVSRDGTLTIIDFDRDDYGDPWEEFNRIVWCAQVSPRFAAGMVDGYFDGKVPQEFWDLLALYICSNTLSSLPWAIPYGQQEIRVMRNQAAEILVWYDNMQTTIPSWYLP
ncbi:MAG: aminoglycoside phosphotransferase family protein [Faecousia sp.]